MQSKKAILADYFQKANSAENYLRWLDRPGLTKTDIELINDLLNTYNKALAKLEDENPWIANVLIAMEENA